MSDAFADWASGWTAWFREQQAAKAAERAAELSEMRLALEAEKIQQGWAQLQAQKEEARASRELQQKKVGLEERRVAVSEQTQAATEKYQKGLLGVQEQQAQALKAYREEQTKLEREKMEWDNFWRRMALANEARRLGIAEKEALRKAGEADRQSQTETAKAFASFTQGIERLANLGDPGASVLARRVMAHTLGLFSVEKSLARKALKEVEKKPVEQTAKGAVPAIIAHMAESTEAFTEKATSAVQQLGSGDFPNTVARQRLAFDTIKMWLQGVADQTKEAVAALEHQAKGLEKIVNDSNLTTLNMMSLMTGSIDDAARLRGYNNAAEAVQRAMRAQAQIALLRQKQAELVDKRSELLQNLVKGGMEPEQAKNLIAGYFSEIGQLAAESQKIVDAVQFVARNVFDPVAYLRPQRFRPPRSPLSPAYSSIAAPGKPVVQVLRDLGKATLQSLKRESWFDLALRTDPNKVRRIFTERLISGAQAIFGDQLTSYHFAALGSKAVGVQNWIDQFYALQIGRRLAREGRFADTERGIFEAEAGAGRQGRVAGEWPAQGPLPVPMTSGIGPAEQMPMREGPNG